MEREREEEVETRERRNPTARIRLRSCTVVYNSVVIHHIYFATDIQRPAPFTQQKDSKPDVIVGGGGKERKVLGDCCPT